MNERINSQNEYNEYVRCALGDLVESSISDVHKGSGKLFESPKYPNKIIRVEKIDELLSRHGNKMEASELVEQARILYKELDQRYGIGAPVEFFIENNPNNIPIVFSVVDRIEGSHLEDVEVSEESLKKVEDLYSSVAKYFIDKYNEGGLYVFDINNQSQYVYGNKYQDDLKVPYLIDTDIWFGNSKLGLFLVVEWLTRHMSGVEKHFGTEFKEARKYIDQFIAQPLPDGINQEQLEAIKSNIKGINKFLNSEPLDDAPETAIPVFG